MFYVERPARDFRASQNRIDGNAQERSKVISSLEKGPGRAGLWDRSMYQNLKEVVSADPDVSELETWEAWVVVMQYYHALFALGVAEKGAEVELLIDHKVRKIRSAGLRSYVNATNWEMAFQLAVTCRDKKKVEGLCRVPVDLLRRAGESDGTQYNEFNYHWIAALQAYVNGTPDLVDELRKAMELSVPSRGAFGGKYLDYVVFPEMDVFLGLVQGESGRFNKSLVFALEKYREYYSGEQWKDRPLDGYLPLHLLSLACLAYDRSYHDKEFTFGVESEYFPKHILEHSWYGEFPV